MTFVVESSEKLAAKCVVLSIDDFVESKVLIFIWTQCIVKSVNARVCVVFLNATQRINGLTKVLLFFR
jgi:hypothetical protein